MHSLSPSQKTRNPALDVVRIIATCSVLGIHFFLNNGFYDQPVMGKRMFLMLFIRNAFLICVPLFLLLTGYLMGQKTFSRRYYDGLLKNICIYVLACIACFVRRRALNPGITIQYLIESIFNYSAAEYSWYIEMYIGLYLLSPFLNLIYCGLTSKKQKQFLLATMLFTTAMPSIFNIHVQLIPDWWINFYPVTYYFLGCYLREYPIRWKKRYFALGYGSLVLLTGVIDYYRCYGAPYTAALWLSWEALPTVLLTLAVFLFFQNVSMKNTPEWLKILLAKLSELCLGAYLTSWIFDSIFYPWLNTTVTDMPLRLNYFPIVVPAVIVLSFAMSYVLSLIYRTFLYSTHMFLHFSHEKQ